MSSLDPSVVRVGIASRDRDSLLRELVDDLHGLGHVTQPEPAWTALVDREGAQSTGIGRGVAFPHARTAHCPELVFAAGRLEDAVDFGAPDGRPVDLVFLLLGPLHNPEEHVRLLARLARLIKREGVLEALRAAPDDTAFRELIVDGHGMPQPHTA